jgi:dihydroorotate dehydrogenase (fumarate)
MVDNVKRVEDAGAAGLVIKSLFEEQIIYESLQMEEQLKVGSERFAESLYYFPAVKHAGPREHLMWVEKTRKAVQMPLFASLNAVSPGNWVSYARQMQETGVDGLELNVYAVQSDLRKTGEAVEKSLYQVVEEVKSQVKIPVAVKLSPFYTSFANVAAELDRRGVAALVLFNRFLQPGIDINNESLRTEMKYSQSHESGVPLRWIALLYGRIEADLAASSGIHNAEAVIKQLLAGAAVVQMASALYTHGIEYIKNVLDGVVKWMEDKGYSKLSDFRGKLSQRNVPDPYVFERAQYVKILMNAA